MTPPCVCGCTRPAAPNSPWYVLCKMIREGWNEATGDYEALPFEAGPQDDTGWGDECEALTNAGPLDTAG